ncbi:MULTISPECIES: O-unit flippase-like protein [Pectobacterium]|uniref:O-unit flippase-like protein n=1 Tax=Pectobacterium TaxID=122277 RepID=UPI0018DA4B97|nr:MULTISPECIES: O-unit flippase-like protein [Pectobacterium]QPI41858.1 hypothetical protein I2D83_15470 [Pectobacterium aroidearum]
MHSVGKKQIITGYLSQILSIGYGVLLLPFMLAYLPQEQVAFWMIILAVISFTGVLDFGFSPTILRAVSYAYNGADKIVSEGFSLGDNSKLNKRNDMLLGDIYISSKKIYRTISAVAFSLLLLLGTYYIHGFTIKSDIPNVWCLWAIFVIGFVLNIYYLYLNPILMGVNKIYESNVSNIIIKTAWIIFSILGLIITKSVLSLAISYLLGVLLGRVYCIYALRNEPFLLHDGNDKTKSVLSAMIPNSFRLGAVTFGAYLINKASIFIGGVYLNSQDLTSFAIAMQVLSVNMAISQVYFNLNIPKFAMTHVNDSSENWFLYKKVLLRSLLIFFIVAFFSVTLGSYFLSFLKEGSHLPSKSALLLIFCFGALELNHTIAATYITTKNTVPFLYPALISGIVIVLLIYVSMRFFSPSMYFLIVIPGVIQLLYNNWKWPYMIYKDFHVK